MKLLTFFFHLMIWLLVLEVTTLATIQIFVSNIFEAVLMSFTHVPSHIIILSHFYCMVVHSKQWAENCQWLRRRVTDIEHFKNTLRVFPIFLGLATAVALLPYFLMQDSSPIGLAANVVPIYLSNCQVMCIVNLFCINVGILAHDTRVNADSLSRVHEIKLLAHLIHSQLEGIQRARELVGLFGLQSLGLAFYAFFYLTLDLFLASSRRSEWDWISLTSLVCDALFRLHLLWLTCHAAFKFNDTAGQFNMELFRLMRENKELCKNEKLQLFVTMKHTVNFTACGFFSIGYPLLTSVIAAATTYLVILVQFSMPS